MTLTLNTSIVNLFASTRATHQFQNPGVYYYAPTRQFSFNQNFLNYTKQPPGTPLLVATVATNPVIMVPPQGQAVSAGQTAVFNVLVTGSLPLAYQWQFDGTNILGTTNTTLTITNASAGNAGFYSVVVTNAFGSQISSNASLTVNYPPVISAQPVSQAAVPGTDVTFSVSAGGTAPLSYQWSFNGSPISSATNSSLVISGVQSNNTGSYCVVVANAAGSVTSSPANLFLANAPDFLWARSASNGAPAGNSAADSIAADVFGNLLVAGWFETPTLDFGGGMLTNTCWSGGSIANFICEYDGAGNLSWVRSAGTNSELAGHCESEQMRPAMPTWRGGLPGIGTFGTNSLVSALLADLFVAKYDSQGQVLWVRQIGAYQNMPTSSYFGFAVDPGGNAFVAMPGWGQRELRRRHFDEQRRFPREIRQRRKLGLGTRSFGRRCDRPRHQRRGLPHGKAGGPGQIRQPGSAGRGPTRSRSGRRSCWMRRRISLPRDMARGRTMG